MYLPFPSYNNPNNTNNTSINNTINNTIDNINTNISERPKILTESFTLGRPLVYSHPNGHMITSPSASPIPSIGHGMHIPPLGLPPQTLQPNIRNGQQYFQEQLHSLQQQQQQQQQQHQHYQHPQHPQHQIHNHTLVEQHRVHHQQLNDTNNSQRLQIIHDSKKKRGRPKKLILDPLTNKYIDSKHPNFKQLNKMVKSSSTIVSTSTHISLAALTSDTNGGMTKLYDQPTYMRTLEDDAVQSLLQKKDKRGRPRKFPIEQTGLTIKGIRVNGTVKQRKRKDIELFHSNGQHITKRERGRPRKTLISSVSPDPDSDSSVLSSASMPYLPQPETRDYRPQSINHHSQLQHLVDNTHFDGPNTNNKNNMYSMSRDPNLSFR